jgi:hypothetical protein
MVFVITKNPPNNGGLKGWLWMLPYVIFSEMGFQFKYGHGGQTHL